MTKNYYSVRLADPNICSDIYATIDIGKRGGMKLSTCIPKEHIDKITRIDPKTRKLKPTIRQWRKYGIKQRYLIPKNNVSKCIVDVDLPTEAMSLCPKNKKGRRELRSLKTTGCSRKKGHKQECKMITKIPDGDAESYRLVSI